MDCCRVLNRCQMLDDETQLNILTTTMLVMNSFSKDAKIHLAIAEMLLSLSQFPNASLKMVRLEVYNALMKSMNTFSNSPKHVEAILRALIVILRAATTPTSFVSWSNLHTLYRVAGE